MSAEREAGVGDDRGLERPVSTAEGEKPFKDLTLGDVEARARELQAATGWGPTARVAGVARAWSELGRAMRQHGAVTVGGLGAEEAGKRARALWVVPPGGSLL